MHANKNQLPVPIQIKLPGPPAGEYTAPVAALNQGLFGQNSFGEINSRANFSNNTLNNSTDYVDQKMGGMGQLAQGEMHPGMRAA